jgi:acylphosphatase
VKRAHVRIRGHVQGVFFRSETRERAQSLGVGGWIRNSRDGSVEAVFEGDDDRVDSLVHWCGRGPRGAVVENVDVEWEEPLGERAFVVR